MSVDERRARDRSAKRLACSDRIMTFFPASDDNGLLCERGSELVNEGAAAVWGNAMVVFAPCRV